jgi:predicted unusual protein kinase regulating ubiquinone biosynthesis (AarF/ABC1/UbiB family)
MASEAEDEPREAGRLPAGRLSRTARVGRMVAGQSLRVAGTRAANRVRSPERAEEASTRRAAALVDQLVEQLGQMRGAAMKVGQMLSLVEFDGLPEDEREALQRRLASLRDDVPPVPFAKLEKLLRAELGGPLSRTFREFDEQAFAAASIGQVHRAVTRDGEQVAVKVQYPGVAEAVETDLRNAGLLLPLVRRLAPGLDGRAMLAELRERIGEELDYELEAQHQRRIARLVRGSAYARVPRVHTELSTRRVLVSEYVEGLRFDAVRQLGEEARDAFGEQVFRFFFDLLYRHGIALGDPHPGNYLLCDDGRVCFLDFGLLRDVPAEHLDAERALAAAVRDDDPEALKAALVRAGYIPAERADAVDPGWAMALMRPALRWYAIPGVHRFSGSGPRRPRRDGRDLTPEELAEARRQAEQFTVPPASLLIRRMHALVATVLSRLRAEADWGAIAAEYLYGGETS